MATTNESPMHLNKLDGTNYQLWKFQMRVTLMASGVYDVVTGTTKKPDDLTTSDGKKWTIDNSKAMCILAGSMMPTQLENCITSDTAHEMWTKVKLIHEQKSAANKSSLLQKFYACRMEPNESVVQFSTKILNMALMLEDLEEKISELAILSKILGSLPSKFNNFVTAWDSVSTQDQTLDNLQERLMKEEKRLSEHEEETSAFIAAKRNIPGNQRSDERTNRPHDKVQGRKTSTLICYNCKKPGHYARACRSKKRWSKGKQTSETNPVAFVATIGNNESQADSFAAQREIEKLMKVDSADVWLTDSGASRHMTFRRDWFHDFLPYDGESVILGHNEECQIEGCGSILINKFIDGEWVAGKINNVLYVPRLCKNLLSVGVCASNGYNISFGPKYVEFFLGDSKVAQGMKQSNQIYRMLFRIIERPEANVSTTSLQRWHDRAGHVNEKSLLAMAKKGVVNGIDIRTEQNIMCEPCQLGKSHLQPFKKDTEHRKWQPGELFHTDVCGPINVTSLGGSRYFLTFIDDASGYRFVYFLKHKSDVYDRFKVFERLVNNKFNRPMKVLRSDNGTEYCNKLMSTLLESKGIKLETSAPHTPQQNGKSERENRTIVESARTMLLRANVPKFLWAEAVSTAVYLLNRTSSSRNPDHTPFEIWTGQKPDYKYLRVFGSPGFVHIPKPQRKKLDEKSFKAIFVGYQGDSRNYKFYNPSTRKISESRNAVFVEDQVGEVNFDESTEYECQVNLKIRNLTIISNKKLQSSGKHHLHHRRRRERRSQEHHLRQYEKTKSPVLHH